MEIILKGSKIDPQHRVTKNPIPKSKSDSDVTYNEVNLVYFFHTLLKDISKLKKKKSVIAN